METQTRVTRLQWKDIAGSTNINVFDRIRTFFRLSDRRIKHGRNCKVAPRVDIKLTDNAVLEIGSNVIISDYAWLVLTKPNPHLKIGSFVEIGRGSIVAVKGNTTIGDYTQVGPFCQIIDHDHSFLKNDLIMNQKAVVKDIKIGRDCWLGCGVKILKGVTVGDGAVIGANSVVTSNIPPYEVWAGVPAKFIKKRE